MAAIFELVVRAGLVVVTAIAAPPIILAYTWRRGDRPLGRAFWRRYGTVLLHVIGA